LLAIRLARTEVPAAEPAPSGDFSATSYIQYPSLQPVTAISIFVGKIDNDLYFPFKKQLKDRSWSCTDPHFYKVAVVDKENKILRQLNIAQVRLIGLDPGGNRYTQCTSSSYPNSIDLVLTSNVSPNDLIQVYVDDAYKTQIFPCEPNKTPCVSDPKPVSFAASSFPAFTTTPQAAPAEALNNGTKRDVGQLNVTFSDTKLFPKSPINLYAKSTDLFSTDANDSKSAMSFTGGIQRGLFPRWYSPLQLQESLQGNQTAKNLSLATSLSISSDPPWLWTHRFLYNRGILMPLPPEPSVANQYTHRINQLVTKKTPRLAQDDYSLNPSLSWNSISFPFACKLLFWERSIKVDKPMPGQVATVCLGSELNLGLWYLPLDLTAAKSQRVEGYGDVSILIPLSDFAVASNALTHIAGGDPSKFQIRVKYADAVNSANNYARTKQWTFGIEALITPKSK
jgi:hypothetical protein